MFDVTDAACRRRFDIPLNAWFPGDRAMPPRLKWVCDHCPIEQRCLEWALEHHEHGIWGGTNAEQRRRLRSKKSRRTCPVCGARSPWTEPDAQVCTACGSSWRRSRGEPAR